MFTSVSIVDVSAVLGLTALVLLTLNFLLGLLLVTGYKKTTFWKKLPGTVKSIKVSRVHNWTAYVAFVLVLLHPLLLIFDPSSKFRLSSVVLPFTAPVQPAFVALGILAFYALVLVILTSQNFVRRALGFRSWKNIHLISYGTAIAICIHGLFLDPELKSRQPDYLDGEKLLCELCFLILVAGMAYRILYYRRVKLQNKKLQVSTAHARSGETK